MKIRCRWEKPGLCGRASMLHVSEQDLADAELVGRAGVRGVIDFGRRADAVALRPLGEGESYEYVPLSSAAGERAIPAEWVTGSAQMPVSGEYVRYAARIVGELVPYAVPLADRADVKKCGVM
jgi:hypothetical protein